MGDAGGSEERTASLRTQLRRAAADVPLLKMKMRRLPSTPPASPPPRVCVHHVSVDQALGTPGAEGACASTNPRGVTERPRSVTPRRNHSVRLAADSRGAVRGPGRLSFSLGSGGCYWRVQRSTLRRRMHPSLWMEVRVRVGDSVGNSLRVSLDIGRPGGVGP
jgi:hypothetical protein